MLSKNNINRLLSGSLYLVRHRVDAVHRRQMVVVQPQGRAAETTGAGAVVPFDSATRLQHVQVLDVIEVFEREVQRGS